MINLLHCLTCTREYTFIVIQDLQLACIALQKIT